MEIAENAREVGDFRKALRYCADAISRDPSAYNLLSLAMLYQDINRHDYAIEECFAMLATNRLDDELLSDLYLILSNSLGKTGHFMQSWYYLSKRADFDEEIEEEEDVKDIFENIYARIEENAKGAKLGFSDEIRDKQYAKCYREASSSFFQGDYDRSLEYAALVKPEASCYKDTLMLMSKCYVYKSDIDSAHSAWLAALKINPNEGGAINGLAVFGIDDKYTRTLINTFESSREEDICYAISAACLKNMYERADTLADILLEKDYYNPKYHFIKGAVRFNMGDKAGAERIYKDILSLYYGKYPVEYMLHAFKRHRNISVMFEHIPLEIAHRVVASIRKEIKAYSFKGAFMSSSAFRQGVAYVLEKNLDAALSGELLREMDLWSNSAVIGQLRTILLKPNVHFEIRRRILVILLHNLRRGKVRIVNENILTSLSLKTPPSYDDYPKQLSTAYCNSFAFLATVGVPFERAISKLVERIYLAGTEFVSVAVLAAAISYICVEDQNVFSIENIAGIFDTSATDTEKAIKAIQEEPDDKA